MPPLQTPYPSLDILLATSDDEFLRVCEVLMRMLNNLVENGDALGSKFRRINMGSDTFINTVLPVPGALDLLFEVGFEEDPSSNSHLVFPEKTPTNAVNICRDELRKEITRRNNIAQKPVETPLVPDSSAKPLCTSQQAPTSSAQKSENCRNFQRIFISSVRQVMRYENPVLQARIRQVVPVERLSEDARRLARINEEFAAGMGDRRELAVRSYLLYALLKWFKEDFFKWVNNAPCDNCQGETEPVPSQMVSPAIALPTSEESKFGAGRVELYLCRPCQRISRFPRFNDPIILLETKRGRCGEWANCFTAVCRALDFDARFVMDNADHVWTEVYSELEGRWLHCDSCETALDQPLTYEVGWGKKLSYVFAFSRHEIVDVSWRYSQNYLETKQRRSDVPEAWLTKTLLAYSERMQATLPKDLKRKLTVRRWLEIIEFLTPNSAKEGEKTGRQSGSLAWRLSRGEIGSSTQSKFDHVIRPAKEEIRDKRLVISYSSATDTYVRGTEKTTGFGSLTFRCENMQRKVENDWKMAYLARSQGSSSAVVSWKIDFTDSGVAPKSVGVRFRTTTYHSAKISVVVLCDDTEFPIDDTGVFVHDFPPDSKCRTVLIKAQLESGEGNEAWQHTQLFREALNSESPGGLKFDVEFF